MSSELRSLPYAVWDGELDCAQMMTIPSVMFVVRQSEMDDERNGDAHHRLPTRSIHLCTRVVNTG